MIIYDCIAEHTNKFTVIACKTAYMFNILGMFIVQSQKSVNQNATKEARRQGMISAYLNFTAITIALVVACWLIGMIVGIEGREYSLRQCIDAGRLPAC